MRAATGRYSQALHSAGSLTRSAAYGAASSSAGLLASLRGSRRTGQRLLLAGEGRGEFGAGDRAGEHRVVVGDRVLVLGSRGGGQAVGERVHLVTPLVAGAHGRLDAAVGQEAAQRHGRDALGAEDEIQVGRCEGVEPALALDEDVTVLRRQVVDDGRAPGALDE